MNTLNESRGDFIRRWQSEMDKAFATIAKTDSNFPYSQWNFRVLVAKLREQAIPEDRWVENDFVSAYEAVKKLSGTEYLMLIRPSF